MQAFLHNSYLLTHGHILLHIFALSPGAGCLVWNMGSTQVWHIPNAVLPTVYTA